MGNFLSDLCNRKDYAKRLIELDHQLSVIRDDFNAVTAMVSRAREPTTTMIQAVAQSMDNELIQEINSVREEVSRGEALPSDLERLREGPAMVQATKEALAR